MVQIIFQIYVFIFILFLYTKKISFIIVISLFHACSNSATSSSLSGSFILTPDHPF